MMQVRFLGCTPLFLVFDVPASVAFYHDLLGFQVVNTSQPFDHQPGSYGWAMLRRDSVTLMINNMYQDDARPRQRDAARALAHRDTVLYISCAELDDLVTRLRKFGVTVSGPVTTYYGMRQVTVLDPDGYSLCFQVPVETK